MAFIHAKKCSVYFPYGLSARRGICDLISRIEDPIFRDKVAVINSDGNAVTFADLCHSAAALQRVVLERVNLKKPISIASYCSSSSDYVVSMIASWKLNWYVGPNV